MPYQFDWAYCRVCKAMHFAGREGPHKGWCAGSDSEHAQAFSPHYAALYDAPPRDRLQQGWASCSKCNVLHFAGFADFKGACTAGAQHEQTGSFNYAVPYDVPGDGRVEQGWKSCRKCQTLYWPDGADHGACPAGAQHDPTGSFAYAAQWLPEKASVNWVGLECIIRQEGEDEVYGGIAVVSADGAYHHTHPFPDNGPYWTMGHDGQRLVVGDIPLYSGPAIGLSVTASLVEWDSDDDAKDKYGKDLAEAAGDAAAVAANSYVPGSGVIAKPVVEFLTKKIIDFLVGNDPYSPGTYTLSEADLTGAPFDRFLLRRDDDPRSALWTHRLELHGTDDGGDEGRYAFYFQVDRAVAEPPLWKREKAYRAPHYRINPKQLEQHPIDPGDGLVRLGAGHTIPPP